MTPVQRLAKGATLFQQGTLGRGVFVVESGEVRVLLPAGQSQRQLLEVAGPGTKTG
jgi:CRP-like cAMP-binding protein